MKQNGTQAVACELISHYDINIATNFLHYHHLLKIQVSSLLGKVKGVRKRRKRTMTRPCPPSKVKARVSLRLRRCPCWRQCPWGRRKFLLESERTWEDELPGQWSSQACRGVIYLHLYVFVSACSFFRVLYRGWISLYVCFG